MGNRGTQKSVLERRASPTFPIVIEMRERQSWVAHWVEESVDALLNGRVPVVQIRKMNPATNKIEASQERYDMVSNVIGLNSDLTAKDAQFTASHGALNRCSTQLLTLMRNMSPKNGFETSLASSRFVDP